MVGAASGGPPVLVHVASRAGLPSSEPTIGKAFAAAGYRTHFTGKWHLGSGCGLLGRSCQGPLAHGFNSTFYLPNTLFERANVEGSFWVWPEEDFHFHALVGTSAAVLAVAVLLKRLKFNVAAAVVMTSLLVAAPAAWFLLAHYRFHTPRWYQVSEWMDFNLNFVVMRQTSVLHQRAPLESLSMDMVRATVDFMRAETASGRRFLAVHAFSHPHTPLVCAPHNRGRSRHGRYGDAVEELDEGVGLLLAALDDMALYNNTIVYFTSDHGGHLEALGADGQRTGGYNGLFKGGKFQGGMEGGIRVPGVLRYPGVVRNGSQLSAPTSLLDVLPTLLELSGLPSVRELLPDAAQPLDGISLSSLLTGAGGAAEDPTRGRLLLHHSGMFVDAIRYNTGEHVYKLHLRRPVYSSAGSYQCGWGETAACCAWRGAPHSVDISQHALLFDLRRDPYEDRPIANTSREYMAVVQHMKAQLEEWRQQVPYPPSQFNSVMDVILLPWLQPFTFL